MEDERKRRKFRKILLIAVLLAAAAVYGTALRSSEQDISVSLGEDSQEEVSTERKEGETAERGENGANTEPEKETVIYVDVGGAVVHPGVVSVAEGSRVFEVIEAVGGTTSEAETKYLNMASECSDGQKLYIPTVSEAEDAAGSGVQSSGLFSADPSAISSQSSEGGGETKVNINTATSEELQTLSGIGPSMAQRIIEYRQANGSFQSVEDLTDVSGIGDKTLEKFISKICV